MRERGVRRKTEQDKFPISILFFLVSDIELKEVEREEKSKYFVVDFVTGQIDKAD